jgi:hypothetical protein
VFYVFEIALVTGAATIALWLDRRFPRLAPASLGGRLAAMIGAGIAVTLAPVSAATRTLLYASIFGAVFPAFVFSFLASLWLLRAVRDGASPNG